MEYCSLVNNIPLSIPAFVSCGSQFYSCAQMPPPSAAIYLTRSSRRQRGSINSAARTHDSDDHQSLSCLTKYLPISLCCSSCRARSDLIMYGIQNKENPTRMCRQLWEKGNCDTQEDGHAYGLITGHLQCSAALIFTTQRAPLSTLSLSRAASGNRAASGT